MEKNIKQGLIIAGIYALGMAGMIAMLIGLSIAMGLEDSESFFSTPYIVLFIVGLVLSFAGGYAFDGLRNRHAQEITKAIYEDTHSSGANYGISLINSDLPENYLMTLSRLKVIGGYASAVVVMALLAIIPVFIFLKENCVGLLCILLALLFAGIVAYIQCRYQYRILYRSRFNPIS